MQGSAALSHGGGGHCRIGVRLVGATAGLGRDWSDAGAPRTTWLAHSDRQSRRCGWLYVLPNGDVLVAETNAPPDRPDDGKGIKAWFIRRFMKKAGAAVPSANRLTLLRDADGDGVAETRTVFLDRKSVV